MRRHGLTLFSLSQINFSQPRNKKWTRKTFKFLFGPKFRYKTSRNSLVKLLTIINYIIDLYKI